MSFLAMTLLTVGLWFAPAFTSAGVDVSGTWDLEMRWNGGMKSTGGCTFKQDGTKLTGTCGSEDSPLTGQIDSRNHLSWDVDVTQDGARGQMKFDGDLDEKGTSISGSCSVVDGANGTFAMKKQ